MTPVPYQRAAAYLERHDMATRLDWSGPIFRLTGLVAWPAAYSSEAAARAAQDFTAFPIVDQHVDGTAVRLWLGY